MVLVLHTFDEREWHSVHHTLSKYIVNLDTGRARGEGSGRGGFLVLQVVQVPSQYMICFRSMSKLQDVRIKLDKRALQLGRTAHHALGKRLPWGGGVLVWDQRSLVESAKEYRRKNRRKNRRRKMKEYERQGRGERWETGDERRKTRKDEGEEKRVRLHEMKQAPWSICGDVL